MGVMVLDTDRLLAGFYEGESGGQLVLMQIVRDCHR
jgi:hypothetical protein